MACAQDGDKDDEKLGQNVCYLFLVVEGRMVVFPCANGGERTLWQTALENAIEVLTQSMYICVVT